MTTTSDRDGHVSGYHVDPSAAVPGAAEVPFDDEQPTVVLTAYGALPAYSPDNVLPSGPVGRHRDEGVRPVRRTAPTLLGRVVLPASLALVSGVALVAAWSHLQDTRAQTVVTAVTPVASAPSRPAAAAPSTAATPAAHSSGAPAPAASPSPRTVVDRSVPVVVLNATSRTGLAARVAARLRADGWTVVSIGNYRHRLTATTVFARGHADAVATIRGDLPTRDAVALPLGAMSTARLTVVLGTDYPRG
ncbi:MAG TPA: LytR C-terminal domain-containing protein [Candidatus Angelobacter sp.]|nr:LytR C-terminal domain-containing protein [Candidatus Angelobacter sp.]